MNPANEMNETEIVNAAEGILRSLLSEVSFLHAGMPEPPATKSLGWRADLILRVTVRDEEWRIVAEYKREAPPRQVRDVAFRLSSYIRQGPNMYGMLVAPFVSSQSADLCKEAGIGYADFFGNCRISFDGVYIERRKPETPQREKRELQSLFSARASRVLRILLTPPLRAWKVQELAQTSGVSVGHVSNVRKLLLNQEFATIDSERGLRVSKPRKLLQQWSTVYKPRPKFKRTFHTILHGRLLDDSIREVFAQAGDGRNAVLSSFSAARWFAPFVRQNKAFFYADSHGFEVLVDTLKLHSVLVGENVVIEGPRQDDVFSLRAQPVPGIWTTGLVHTYLDIAVAGERGEEAAEHLMREKLIPAWGPTNE